MYKRPLTSHLYRFSFSLHIKFRLARGHMFLYDVIDLPDLSKIHLRISLHVGKM